MQVLPYGAVELENLAGECFKVNGQQLKHLMREALHSPLTILDDTKFNPTKDFKQSAFWGNPKISILLLFWTILVSIN